WANEYARYPTDAKNPKNAIARKRGRTSPNPSPARKVLQDSGIRTFRLRRRDVFAPPTRRSSFGPGRPTGPRGPTRPAAPTTARAAASSGGECDPDSLSQVELRLAEALMVLDRHLDDRDFPQRALREDVRLEVEPVRGQAEGLEPLRDEGPHPAAEVGDGRGVQEGREPAEQAVPEVVRGRHGPLIDLAEEPGSEDDRRIRPEEPDEVRDRFGRVGAVRVHEEGN